MANSAFGHEPSFTTPGSTTDNAVIRWDGTSGGGQQNSGIIIDDSNVITGVTSLTVDNLLINGNTISSTAGTDLFITPLGGQQLILDGTIIIDAGVVTAATSITSTEFVGGGVGLTALNGTQITSGTVPVARLGDGNESNSTFLRGDNTWVAVTGTTINTNADNRVITGSGTANTLNGESSLTYDGTTLALSAATTKVFTVETTATDTVAEMRLEVAASSTSENYIQFRQGDGSGSANNMAYRIGYNAGDGYFRFRSGDTDGSSADADVWRVNDGTKELIVADNATFRSVPSGLAKAWGKWDGGAAQQSYNATISFVATGKVRLTYTTGLAANATTLATLQHSTGRMSNCGNINTGYFEVFCFNNSHSLTDTGGSAAAFGDS